MENSSPILAFGSWLGAIACVIGRPISGYFQFQFYLTARESGAWPNVPGQIIKADVGTTIVGRSYADLSYSYKVGGREFTGHRIRASDGEYGSRDGAVRAIQGLAPGQRVAVYFDPDELARSVLRPGAGSQEYIQLLVSVVMFSLGFALVLALWRSRGQRSETGANAKATSPRAMTSA
jgi:hypothetical protein